MKKTILLLLTLLFLTVNIAIAAININTADEKTLATLPGIGEAKAAAIVQYRKDNGNFKSPQDIVQVKGIGQKVFEKLSKEITVE
ncbi:competence protein ComEA-like protein with helix-hairpin-helix repeat region [Desulfocapsa sulfexigens DSM 10523]|uniref:Competence protein ComEA-like protein with helix-hairpin-helix repeat region n=1 Tax=Desulfocapsa sulfexigens (strain DSM 10523 / SB164P1) TaxID=1167006 RepID=M1PPJ3_DESSD|nr:helix-hairpin-helix domain-containing protein [Desulfocapsa sulfexigens]AGF78341.1 competence protein ComEA-like protein with helix-hairpin-helix repeat region [Desulfocapsa sulfexigens DSM 10523]